MAVLSLNRCAEYLQRWIVSLKGYMSIIPEVTPIRLMSGLGSRKIFVLSSKKAPPKIRLI
jgi:hypothetical protein